MRFSFCSKPVTDWFAVPKTPHLYLNSTPVFFFFPHLNPHFFPIQSFFFSFTSNIYFLFAQISQLEFERRRLNASQAITHDASLMPRLPLLPSWHIPSMPCTRRHGNSAGAPAGACCLSLGAGTVIKLSAVCLNFESLSIFCL
jgi:hypothetical protein